MVLPAELLVVDVEICKSCQHYTYSQEVPVERLISRESNEVRLLPGRTITHHRCKEADVEILAAIPYYCPHAEAQRGSQVARRLMGE